MTIPGGYSDPVHSVTQRKKPQKKKKAPAKSRTKGREFRARVRKSHEGFPEVRVPAGVGNALGGEPQIQVRVTLNEIPFHAVINRPYKEPRPFDFEEELDETDYTLYMYKEMREAIPMRYGTTLRITVIGEEHPLHRRGKRIRAKAK